MTRRDFGMLCIFTTPTALRENAQPYRFWGLKIFSSLTLRFQDFQRLMQLVGVSPALGTFVAGVVLANSEYRHTLQTDIEPFKGLLLGLFFISVGMGMEFHLFADSPLRLVLAVTALITVKALILFMLGKFFGLNALHNSGFALALAQGGEFAFVLFQFAGTLNILPQVQGKFLTLVVATSIAVTPLLIVLYNRLIVPKFLSELPERSFDRIEEENPIILAGFGRFGQVIGRFLNAQGIKTTVLEKDPDQIELLRKFGFKGYFGDASRLDLIRTAGAANAKLLIVAVDDPETSLEIVKLVKGEFPHLKIFVRARNRRHAYELSKVGVDYYKREVFDSSLEMAQQIMVSLGKNESDIRLKAIKFKEHDEAALKASFDFFDDEPELVSFSRTQRAELERVLQNDASGDSSN